MLRLFGVYKNNIYSLSNEPLILQDDYNMLDFYESDLTVVLANE